MADDTIKKVVDAAMSYMGKARTFRSSVGVAFEMYDGTIFGGFNIETYAHKGYHAEEVGVIRALAEGYNHTDFRRMVEVFQDAGHDEIEIYPACPLHCWGTLLEFTHPYLEIVVADTEGNVHYSTRLKDMFNLKPPAKIYPSNRVRMAKPKLNIQPKLPLNEELNVFCASDPDFREYCDGVLKVRI